ADSVGKRPPHGDLPKSVAFARSGSLEHPDILTRSSNGVPTAPQSISGLLERIALDEEVVGIERRDEENAHARLGEQRSELRCHADRLQRDRSFELQALPSPIGV